MAVVARDARIVNPLGLHARPAAEFVKVAGRFACAILVSKDGVTVNGKSILGMMALAAECGSSLSLRTDGVDAEAAMDALCALVSDGFREMHLTGNEEEEVSEEDERA
jgi:phosphocarrier protein HPr